MEVGAVVKLLSDFLEEGEGPYAEPIRLGLYGDVGVITRVHHKDFLDIRLQTGNVLDKVWTGSVVELSPLEQLARAADDGI